MAKPQRLVAWPQNLIMRAYCSNSFKSPNKRGQRWKLLVIIFILGFVAGFVLCQYLQTGKPVEIIFSTSVSGANQNFVEQNPGSLEIWSESGNISVRAPQANSVVSSHLIVEGMERTFEQNVVLRLKDRDGNEIVKTSVQGSAPDMGIHGPYRAELVFEKPKTATGVLEVFQQSAKDGSEIDMVRVPVRFE